MFQRRQDSSVNFYRGWQDYKYGFGDLNGNFWLGLNKLHRLTKSGQNVLRVDLTDWTEDTAYAKYRSFSVASESDSYRLNVGSYSGKYDLRNIINYEHYMYMNVYNINETCTSNALTNVWQRTIPVVVAGTIIGSFIRAKTSRGFNRPRLK